MAMDWDKLRVFHAVAEAGSFTHAGESLNLSQSAVSRQISALEESLRIPLFHRHARGLILTEQGELLHKTARDIFAKLSMTEAILTDSREKPKGPLKITATFAFGSIWLASRLGEFKNAYPDIEITLLIDDEELDLAMRQADVAIRMMPPRQPDLVQRHLCTIHFHIYAGQKYLETRGAPKNEDDLKRHTLIAYPPNIAAPFQSADWLLDVSGAKSPEGHPDLFLISNMMAIHQAVAAGSGLAVMPDFLVDGDERFVRVLPDLSGPDVEAYFVYPEELRHSKRIAVFRDFLLEKVAKSTL